MKKIMVCLALLLVAGAARAEEKKPVTLKTILLEQLRTTHNQKEWFVPANVALQGVSAEQASWRDGKGNHSIGQLAYHLVFWNQQVLAKFKGEQPAKVFRQDGMKLHRRDSSNRTGPMHCRHFVERR